MKKYDLVVVGGGFSGFCAAVSAARHGLKVLLAEQSNCLGGAAANALVNPFMRYWTMEDNKRVYLSKGMFGEIVDKLKSAEAMCEEGSCRHDTKFNEEYLKLLFNRMAIEAGVQLLYHAYLTGAKVENGTVKSAVFATKSGMIDIEADYFVDATGDADLAAGCGCPTRLGRDGDHLCQPMTLSFRLGNVDMEKYFETKDKINPLYKEYQKKGKIKNIYECVLIFTTMIDGVLHFNSTRVVRKNPLDVFEVTEAEIDAREQVFELYHFLKEHFEAFKNAELLMTAMQIGVRESRMIDGDYVLTGKDIINCTKFEDAVAAANYDIDIHNPEGSGTSHHYFEPGTYYTIPYRCLIPQKTENLLVVGRCISVDHEAQASCRIMPTCATVGQAAGTAISLAAKGKTNVRNIDIKKLQTVLKEDGAFF